MIFSRTEMIRLLPLRVHSSARYIVSILFSTVKGCTPWLIVSQHTTHVLVVQCYARWWEWYICQVVIYHSKHCHIAQGNRVIIFQVIQSWLSSICCGIWGACLNCTHHCYCYDTIIMIDARILDSEPNTRFRISESNHSVVDFSQPYSQIEFLLHEYFAIHRSIIYVNVKYLNTSHQILAVFSCISNCHFGVAGYVKGICKVLNLPHSDGHLDFQE